MTMKKKRLLSAIAVLCICLCFALRYINEQVSMSQVCPGLSDGSFEGSFVWDGMSSSVSLEALISDEEFQNIFAGTILKHGREYSSLPSPALEIHLFHDGGNHSIIIGADNTVSIAKFSDLDGTRTFWTEPTGTLFQALYALHINAGGEALPNNFYSD